FFSNKYQDGSQPAFMTIMDNDTITQFNRKNFQEANDWKMNDNGMFTFFDDSTLSWVMLDSSFNPVDSFVCENGYEDETNDHELRIFPDGHSLIGAFDHLTIDMTQYVPDGYDSANVIGY